MNINAFLKYVVVSRKIKISNLSEQLSLDIGYLSRVINNKKTISIGRNLEKICHALNLDMSHLIKEDDSIRQLYQEYLNATFYLERENRNNLYQQVSQMKDELAGSPSYLYYLMVCFVQNVVTKKYDTNLSELLYRIYPTFDEENQIIFLIFYYGLLRETEKYSLGNDIYQKISTYRITNQQHIMMLNYYHFSYGFYNGKSIDYIKSYDICKEICLSTNNNKRLVNLNILYSIHLRDLGYIEDGLNNDLKTLEYMTENNLNYCIDIITNNIANSYLLLEEYENAIDYFKQSIQLLDNNSKHFYIALCYYRLDKFKKAKQYIESGKLSKNRQNYYYDLLLWLEHMINNKYSKKSYLILKSIYDNNLKDLVEQQRSFIKMELINYYIYHKDYPNAFKLATDLINKNITTQTKILEKV